MFLRKTLFILGAGASTEFQMPSGLSLIGNIRKLLSENAQSLFDRLEGAEAYARSRAFNACIPRLVPMMDGFKSMDEILHFFSDEPEVIELGKYAIAFEILKSEKKSSLSSVMNGHAAFSDEVRLSWANDFLRLAMSGASRVGIERIFKNVTIIDFNYDRVFPQFLFWALQHYYTLSSEEAKSAIQNLTIVHPYGYLGPLGFQSGAESIAFGSLKLNLAHIAANIKTYTEERQTVDLNSIRRFVEDARVIILIGFGFHKQNISLLATEGKNRSKDIFATVYGIDELNHELMSEALGYQLGSSAPAKLYGYRGSEFMKKLGQSISIITA